MQKESMSRIRQKTKKVKQSGGRVLFRLIFGRTMITVLLLLLQILCLIGIFRMVGLSENLLTISNLLGMAAIIYIINSEENPAFKLAWVLPISVCAGVRDRILSLYHTESRKQRAAEAAKPQEG